MHRFMAPVLVAACLMGTVQGQGEEEEIGCVGCHLEQDPPYSTPAETVPFDVHGQAGFTCVDCHGGDPDSWDFDEAKDPAKGFIGIPTGLRVVELCGQCHSNQEFMQRYNPNLPTDQVAQYWTSGHGRSLQAGNPDVAQCASCHNPHDIKRVADPGSTVYHANVAETCGNCHAEEQLISRYGLSSDIVQQYRSSVHGVALHDRGDMAAPTCNDCHGNHGAAPPQVESAQEACGTCHVNNQLLFSQSKMRTIFITEGYHGCATCHTAHDIQKTSEEMVGLQEGSVCAQCHEDSADDPGGLQARYIRSALETLKDTLRLAEEGIAAAENRGLVVTDLLLDMQTARTALIQSRTMVHTFDAARVTEEGRPGIILASKIISEVKLLMRELRNRKIWLGFATMFMVFTATVLHFYVKTLD
ncbi:MAG: cytochrome c3 family protein [Candidatus Marinimicrobia bacterium]|nr:cytochrome c3 family protein [Candidatus Neomarinimicrobiota bacterium]